MLITAGHEVLALADPLEALDVLEIPDPIHILLTRVAFPPGKPNGVALARMARNKRPGISVIFAGRAENQRRTEGLGLFLPIPFSARELLLTVERMLDASPVREPSALSPLDGPSVDRSESPENPRHSSQGLWLAG